MEDPHGLAEWAENNVPAAMRSGPIWRLPAYRFALYLGDLAQIDDAPQIRRDYRTRPHLSQFLDAVGSISSNIAEGYGRTSGPERAKFYEYSESSSREAVDWYFKVRFALDPAVFDSRIDLLFRIQRIQRTAIIRERSTPSRAREAAVRPRRLTSDARADLSTPPTSDQR